MAYLQLNVSTDDISSQLQGEPASFAELIESIAEDTPSTGVSPEWLGEFCENLGIHGRAFVRQLALAIADDEAQ